MPKEGFASITISDALDKRISEFIEKNQEKNITKSQAVHKAWELYETLSSGEKNPKPVRIGNRLVGPNQPVFFIAEIGINHNGDIEIAKKLIDVAVEKGCDAVKFQKRYPNLAVPEYQKNIPRETPWGFMTYLEYKKKLEFGEEEFKEIDRYCREKNIIWFASPWDEDSVDFLEKFNVPCHKIPSACLTNKGLLLKVKATGKPIILSTGMSTLEEIKKAVSILGEENLIILQCTSTYPAKDEDLDLNVIKTYRKMFNCPIGYSGHEPGYLATLISAPIGACVVEKHITLDKSMWGTDQASSLDPTELGKACRGVKRAKVILGNHQKSVRISELPVMDKLRFKNDLFSD